MKLIITPTQQAINDCYHNIPKPEHTHVTSVVTSTWIHIKIYLQYLKFTNLHNEPLVTPLTRLVKWYNRLLAIAILGSYIYHTSTWIPCVRESRTREACTREACASQASTFTNPGSRMYIRADWRTQINRCTYTCILKSWMRRREIWQFRSDDTIQ